MQTAAARACSSVTSTRAPLAPIGWPRAIAPPRTLVLAGSRPKRPHAGQALSGEGFVQFDQIDVGQRQPGLGQHVLDRADRGDEDFLGRDARRGRGHDAGLQGRVAAQRQACFGRHDHGRRAVAELRGIAGRRRVPGFGRRPAAAWRAPRGWCRPRAFVAAPRSPFACRRPPTTGTISAANGRRPLPTARRWLSAAKASWSARLTPRLAAM